MVGDAVAVDHVTTGHVVTNNTTGLEFGSHGDVGDAVDDDTVVDAGETSDEVTAFSHTLDIHIVDDSVGTHSTEQTLASAIAIFVVFGEVSGGHVDNLVAVAIEVALELLQELDLSANGSPLVLNQVDDAFFL